MGMLCPIEPSDNPVHNCAADMVCVPLPDVRWVVWVTGFGMLCGMAWVALLCTRSNPEQPSSMPQAMTHLPCLASRLLQLTFNTTNSSAQTGLEHTGYCRPAPAGGIFGTLLYLHETAVSFRSKPPACMPPDLGSGPAMHMQC